MVGDPVSTLDLAATMFDYSDVVPHLGTHHGTSLRPLFEGATTREYALDEWELLPTRTGVALVLRTVRTGTHRLTVDLRSGAGELYDLEGDPDEDRNLFGAPEAAGVRRELDSMLARRPDDAGPIRTPVGICLRGDRISPCPIPGASRSARCRIE